ncbi:MAG: hypothetical protein ACRDO4_00130, partial [Nocardioides sp.]
ATESSTEDYVLLLDDDSDPDQILGQPGAYALTARGATTAPLAVLDVPPGYSNFGFFALNTAEGPWLAVQYWTVDGVFTNPCKMDEDAPHAGTTVNDLAAALAAQELTSASEPVPVSLDGNGGLYLELTAPSDISFEDCGLGGYFGYWEGKPDDAQHTVGTPGTVDHIWILDVDGVRIVLVAIEQPGLTPAQVGELTDMVESVRFVDQQ